MKTFRSLLAVSLCAWAGLTNAQAQVVIPSDGSDGVLDITASTVIDLSQATTAKWNANNAAHAGQGVYDPDKWAVVFKYQSVKIAAGATVTFANHPSRAPVVWLVQNGVIINGTINVDGRRGLDDLFNSVTPVEPGPGGFRGGASGPQGGGAGLGPGGFASSYGSPQLVPLIGGSGEQRVSGGGAILIACANIIDLEGKISADGVDGGNGSSGGGIRLVANSVIGTGSLEALGGNRQDTIFGHGGDSGRIRIETLNFGGTIRSAPETIAVLPANPPVIWPPDSAPKIRILRTDGVDAPVDPTAALTRTADIVLQNDNASEVVLETTNFPLEGIVELKNTIKFGGSSGWIRATYAAGDFARATWKVTYPFPKGFNALQARAFLP